MAAFDAPAGTRLAMHAHTSLWNVHWRAGRRRRFDGRVAEPGSGLPKSSQQEDYPRRRTPIILNLSGPRRAVHAGVVSKGLGRILHRFLPFGVES